MSNLLGSLQYGHQTTYPKGFQTIITAMLSYACIMEYNVAPLDFKHPSDWSQLKREQRSYKNTMKNSLEKVINAISNWWLRSKDSLAHLDWLFKVCDFLAFKSVVMWKSRVVH